MKTILSAAAALAIIVGSSAAFADSGDAPQTSDPAPYSNETITAAPLTSNVGNEAEAVFTGPSAVIAQGTASLLPFNGNEAPVQTANSAPVGFGTTTLALAAPRPAFFGFLAAR